MGEIGFYSQGHSYLHTLHATAKIVIFAVLVTLLPFALGHWQSDCALALALGAVIWSARIRRKQLLFFSPALGLVVIAAVSWLFTDLGGRAILKLGGGPYEYILREHTLDQVITSSLRALIWVLAYVALLTTTNSRDLIAGLEKLGLPYRASRIVGMTLKFWTTVITDMHNVMNAQRVRGVDFEQGSKLGQLKQRFIITTIPTTFLMLKRFRTLSFALALRAFGAQGKKTRLYAPDLTSRDGKFLIIALILLLCLGLVDHWGSLLWSWLNGLSV